MATFKKSKKTKRSSNPIPPAPPPPPIGPSTTTSVLEMSSSSHTEEEPPRSESPVDTPTKPSLAPKPKRLHKTLSAKSFPTFWKQKGSKKDEKGENKSDERKGKKEDKTESRSEEKQRKQETATEGNDEEEVKASIELRDSPLWKLPGLTSITRRHSTTSIDQVPQKIHSQSPRPTSVITEHPAEQVQECETSPKETPIPEIPPRSEITVQSDSLPDIPETLEEPPELPPRPESPLDLPSDQTDSDVAPELPPLPPPKESKKVDLEKQIHSSKEHLEPGNTTEHSVTALTSTEEPTTAPPSDISPSSDATSESLVKTENVSTTAPTNPEPTLNPPGKSNSSAIMNKPASPKMDPTLRPLPEIPSHLRPLPKTPPVPHTEISKSEKRPEPPPKPKHLTQQLQRPGSPTGNQDTPNESPVQERKPFPAVTVEVGESVPSATTASLPESLSVGELVNKYSKKFPLRIKVLQGYSEETSELNISTDDVYDIHFIKHTKVVKIKDEDSYTYSLPLGSAMKFGFVYNPNNNLDEALSGFQFERVADITAMSTLPKVVCATASYQTSDDKAVIEENEIFVVRHVHRTMFKGKKGLKVFSALSKTERVLPEECVGHFSTKPSLVRMHLPEIIEYIQIPFPSQAVMYHGGQATGPGQSQPATQSRVVTMCDCNTETSLVASLVAGAGEEEDGDQQLFDIPVDENSSEIEVKILKYSTLDDEDDEEPEHIYDDTINALQNFDPTKLQSLKSSYSGSKANLQSLLLTNVREGYEREGIEVESPYVNITEKISMKQRYSDDDDPDNPYDTVGIKRQASSPSNRKSFGYDRVGDRSENHEDPRLTCWLEDLQSSTHALDSRLRSLEHSSQSTELNKMQTLLEGLVQKIESVDIQLHNLQQPTAAPQSLNVDSSATAAESISVEETNKMYLSSLDAEQVAKMLEAMKLGQYKDGFLAEQITGEILVECDEEVLQYELGMSSKIHRIKLMKMISGQHSAKAFVES